MKVPRRASLGCLQRASLLRSVEKLLQQGANEVASSLRTDTGVRPSELCTLRLDLRMPIGGVGRESGGGEVEAPRLPLLSVGHQEARTLGIACTSAPLHCYDCRSQLLQTQVPRA